MTEDMSPRPEDPYGVAKLAVEMDLRAAHEQFGLPYIIFRPHNVYGEGQNIGDKYRNVVGIFMNQIMQGKPLTVFGNGEQTRAFSYIADVAPVIARAPSVSEARGQVFNVGGGVPYTVNELADAVMAAMGTCVEIRHLAARNEVLHAHASHEKAHTVFDTPPTTDLKTGLAKMAAWARDVGSRESTPFENIEIRQGLPEGWS